MIRVWTDGSGGVGRCGWCAILRAPNGYERVLTGHEDESTNNRAELLGAIHGLAAIKAPSIVLLTTDSEYLRLGITQWVGGWQRRGWMTSTLEPVKNRDLWERLVAETARHQVSWEWTRGHTGHPENERADMHARRARLGLKAIVWAPGGPPTSRLSAPPGLG